MRRPRGVGVEVVLVRVVDRVVAVRVEQVADRAAGREREARAEGPAAVGVAERQVEHVRLVEREHHRLAALEEALAAAQRVREPAEQPALGAPAQQQLEAVGATLAVVVEERPHDVSPFSSTLDGADVGRVSCHMWL